MNPFNFIQWERAYPGEERKLNVPFYGNVHNKRANLIFLAEKGETGEKLNVTYVLKHGGENRETSRARVRKDALNEREPAPNGRSGITMTTNGTIQILRFQR